MRINLLSDVLKLIYRNIKAKNVSDISVQSFLTELLFDDNYIGLYIENELLKDSLYERD